MKAGHGLSELHDRAYRQRAASHAVALDEALRRHRAEAAPVVERVRSRLVDAAAFDALAALDRLSTSERYLLAQREIGA